jgi:phosphohistidine phosphatase SixA
LHLQEDQKRVLTPLGREQAELTGIRLAEMIKGAEDQFGPCNVKVMFVSGMTRAQETGTLPIHAKHVEVSLYQLTFCLA